MRHSAVTFADEVRRRLAEGRDWDLVFCSDILNLAEFLGLAPRPVREWPTILYFHENQFTYPVRFESERDCHFAVTNMTSALAATSVRFNSAFHRDSFLEALTVFLRKMPDYQSTDAIEHIRGKAAVHPPGANVVRRGGDREVGPLRILWAARWEHDKSPEDFFKALKILKSRDIEFRISVIGEQFREAPETFEWARRDFAEHIDRWGYQESRGDYERALTQADVFVSTAKHEFFGITAVEAILAGAYPVLPKRLAYPEILGLHDNVNVEELFYDGSVNHLAEKLTALAERVRNGCLWTEDTRRVARSMERFTWEKLADTLDEAVDRVGFNH
jgi:glycosyltransferase involved in cell wall biosynthesis